MENKKKNGYIVLGGILLLILIIYTQSNGESALPQGDDTVAPQVADTVALKCEIGTEKYSIGIEGESGKLTIGHHNEGTQFGYNANGQRETITITLNRTLTYEDSGNSYDVTGYIEINELENSVSYDIQAIGEPFGDVPQTCVKGKTISQ